MSRSIGSAVGRLLAVFDTTAAAEAGPPLLALALVLPLLALVGVIVLGIAAERGMFR